MKINPKTEQQRQDYLDWLYQQSGRTNCLYTGLYQSRSRVLMAADMAAALNTKEAL